MNKNVKLCFIVSLLFLHLSLFSMTVSISLVQNESAPQSAIKMSQIAEEQLLNNFFNNGFIVSNTPIRFDGINFKNKNYGLKEATFGLSDILFVYFLQYNANEKTATENNSSYAQLEYINWKILSVPDGRLIKEGQKKIDGLKLQDNDPYKYVRTIMDSLYKENILYISN